MNTKRLRRQGATAQAGAADAVYVRTRHPHEKRLFVAFGLLAVLLGLIVVSVAAVLFGVIGVALLGSVTVLARHRFDRLSSVEVTRDQLPHFWAVFELCASRLQLRTPARFFLRQQFQYNAFVSGIREQHIVVYSRLALDFDRKELAFILGHEMGHVIALHTRLFFFYNGPTVSKDPVSWIFQRALGHAKEYTADRYGLLACRDLSAAISALLKIAVGPELLQQIEVSEMLRQIEHVSKGRAGHLFEFGISTHPGVVRRIRELVRFYHSAEYAQLTGGDSAGVEATLLPTLMQVTALRTGRESRARDTVVDTLIDVDPASPSSMETYLVHGSGRVEGLALHAKVEAGRLIALHDAADGQAVWQDSQGKRLEWNGRRLRVSRALDASERA
jgi:Zn-dependent protease with chaperone function